MRVIGRIVTKTREEMGLPSTSTGLAKPISYVVTENGCHDCFSHAPGDSGHPRLWIGHLNMNIMRALYIAHRGPIPAGLCCRHRCNNVKCINLDHIVLGTHLDNIRDKVLLGRPYRKLAPTAPRGDPVATLTGLPAVVNSPQEEIRVIAGIPIKIFTVSAK